ncbi:MAG: hypothetical protein WCI03_07990 [bacterium]|jgi:hypothetical protein
MKMKTLVVGWFAVGMVCGQTGFAQMVGLPVMDTASPRDQGNLEITPGVMLGQDMDFYGARVTVAVVDDLRLFFDVGQVDLTEADSGYGAQGGALYSLSRNDLVDLGIRGAVYYMSSDLLGLTGANGMLVFSDETLLDHLFLYGGAGLDVVYKSIDTKWGASSSQSEINPAFSLGLSYQFNDSFSLFTEANYVDGLYAGVGLSIR